MMHSDDARRENAAPRERSAALSAASLRISASLDLDTVRAEVVESARGLAGTRYGVIATVDKAGTSREFGFSGITPEEERELAARPDGSRLFSQPRDLPGPPRLAGLSDYVRSLGFASAPAFQSTFPAIPMRHRSRQVGHLFLAGKAHGEEFSDDAEVLKLVASQAAAEIANTRTHRNERRVRADLEALVETSPAVVMVVDLQRGRVLDSLGPRRVVRRDAGGLGRQPAQPRVCRVAGFRTPRLRPGRAGRHGRSPRWPLRDSLVRTWRCSGRGRPRHDQGQG